MQREEAKELLKIDVKSDDFYKLRSWSKSTGY
jgi:hypothetical protein